MNILLTRKVKGHSVSLSSEGLVCISRDLFDMLPDEMQIKHTARTIREFENICKMFEAHAKEPTCLL